MSHITISSLYDKSADSTVTHVVSHGVRDGHYGDLWSIRRETPGRASSSGGELARLADLLWELGVGPTRRASVGDCESD